MCWDQIVEGYLIPNTGEKSEGSMLHTQQNSEYECLKSATNEVINAIVSPPGGILVPRGPIYRVVRRSGNNVRTAPLAALFTLSI
jgi:hypothetical protein